MSSHGDEMGVVIEGPFESSRTRDSWCWDRPNGGGGLHYNRPEILLRCARIFGGSVKVYRTVEHSVTTIHAAAPPSPRPIVQRGAGAGMAHVEGHCPACEARSLFVGAGQYVTCGNLDCSDPTAPSKALGVTFPPGQPEADQ